MHLRANRDTPVGAQSGRVFSPRFRAWGQKERYSDGLATGGVGLLM